MKVSQRAAREALDIANRIAEDPAGINPLPTRVLDAITDMGWGIPHAVFRIQKVETRDWGYLHTRHVFHRGELLLMLAMVATLGGAA